MSSTDGTEQMRRHALLSAPIEERVQRLAEVALLFDDCVDDEQAAKLRTEMWVLGTSVAGEVLSALVAACRALESMAKDARAGAGATINPLTNFGENR